MKSTFSAIFSDYTPNHFGLCGEAFLWEEFRSHFLAKQDIASEATFITEMNRTFEALTGASILSKQFVFVERYNHGGMSSGLVDPWNWAFVIVPDLLRRYKICNNTN